MINEASFSKPITNITSQEELYKVLNKCLKNNIKVRFNIPFMTKEDYDKLNAESSAWRFGSNFNYQDYYKNEGFGTLTRIDRKEFVIINPDDKNFVTDNRLSISTLYTELVHSEDFKMYIDDNEIDFRNETGTTKSLEKNNTNIDSLESFVKILKKCDKSKIIVAFEMPFAKKEYLDDLKQMDSYTRVRNEQDPSFREKYEEISTGSMKYISVNKYVYIAPDDAKLLGDQRLTFGTLYNSLKNDSEDFRMFIDNHEITFFDNVKESITRIFEKDINIMSDKLGKDPKFNDLAAKAASKFKKGDKPEVTSEDAPKPGKTDSKQKFVIELSFNYDGDSDLADAIESQLGKTAEVNEVLRTRRIMEFDFKNKEMFDAAMRTIQSTMKEKGKSDYKLDSRVEDDVEAPGIDGAVDSAEAEEIKELKESLNAMIEENRYPITVTLPLIMESLSWASRSRASEQAILEFATNLVLSNKKGTILDI